MDLITDPTAAPSDPGVPSLTGTRGWFTGGVPGVTSATRVRYWWLNMLINELLAVVTAAGITPSPTNQTQLLAALNTLYTGGTPPSQTGRLISVQVVSSGSGNVTVPTGATACRFVLVGGGAGGSGSGYNSTYAPPYDTGWYTAGSGGGGGETVRKLQPITGLTAGATCAYSIGAGGTHGSAGSGSSNGGLGSAGSNSTFTVGGTTYTAHGAAQAASWVAPGPGGTGSSSGDENLAGSDGGYQGGCCGGGTAGGAGLKSNQGLAGLAGNAPGGGGSGADIGSNQMTAYAGGDGAAGRLTVEWLSG
jgi:hypothetical protein